MSLKNKVRELIYSLLNILAYFRRPERATILMYHSVGDSDLLFNVSLEDFLRQINYLKKGNYRVLKLTEVIDKIKRKERIEPKTVVITFDDGYKDNYQNVFPALNENNFPATIFIPTSYIGSKFNGLDVLDWKEIKEMASSGLIDFGFHSHTHPHKMSGISIDNFSLEISEAKKILEKNLFRFVPVFAYPRGSYNDKQIELLKREGFSGAVTVEEGLVGENDDPMRLKRNFIYNRCSFAEFKGKLGLSVVWFNFIKHLI